MKEKKINYKNIHIGSLIYRYFVESNIDVLCACNFNECTEEEIENLSNRETLDSGEILSWSKLLRYDFF